MAAENTVRCTICNRLCHTAGVSKDRLPPASARAVMSVISGYNCGRMRQLANRRRKVSNNELCGPRGHAKFGSLRNDIGYCEP